MFFRGSARLGGCCLLFLAACSHAALDEPDASVDLSGVVADGSNEQSDGSVTAPSCTAPDAGPPAGSPTIVVAPSPVGPSQAALLLGANVGVSATVTGVQLPDGNPGLPPRPDDCLPAGATALTVLEASDVSVKAELPATWTTGLYALVVTNAAGTSVPVVLNRPRIDWIRGGPGGVIVSGSTVDVYGRSFGKMPQAWVKSASGAPIALASTTSDGYAATFSVPASLSAGTYGLYVHSGQGGPAGFSDAFAVTVAAPAPWPTKVFPVAAGTGNDDKALAAALSLATTNKGGIVQLAKGTYTLHAGVVIPPFTVLTSATGKRGDVIITFDEPTAPAFPFGFASDGNFVLASVTVTSSTSARLVQCPNGADFMRDPVTGSPAYQPDAPCVNATVHDVSLTLTTQRDLVQNGMQTTTPAATDLLVMNGTDCEISDSTIENTGGSSIALAKAKRFNVLRNTLSNGSARVSPSAAQPLTPDETALGGSSILYNAHEVAIVGNTVGAGPNLGAGATMGIEYDAVDVYVADNVFGPNLTDYGEGFSLDAPYNPSFLGLPKSVQGRVVTIARVLGQDGNSVFQGNNDGTWPASGGSAGTIASVAQLGGETFVVVNGTGLGEYAEVASNTATASDGTTKLTLDRDLPIALDGTSVVEVAMPKARAVFARNTFHDVGVGVQLYAGGYDMIIDGTAGESIDGTYCYGDDFMTGPGTDPRRRFSRCYFVQWLNSTLTDAVDASYAWAKNPSGGLFKPYPDNGLLGVHLAIGQGPMVPAQRGLSAVGNIIRDNHVSGLTFGLDYLGGNGPLPSPLPTLGRDNIVEQNGTQAVAIGTVVQASFPGSLVRDDSCAPGCTTTVQNDNDGGTP